MALQRIEEPKHREPTDREMLYLCYGALKAVDNDHPIGKAVEDFLWPAQKATIIPDGSLTAYPDGTVAHVPKETKSYGTKEITSP